MNDFDGFQQMLKYSVQCAPSTTIACDKAHGNKPYTLSALLDLKSKECSHKKLFPYNVSQTFLIITDYHIMVFSVS